MNNDRFQQLCSVTIAVVSIFTALLAYVQTDAGHRDDRANRDSKQYALKAFGLKVRGHSEAKFAYHEAFKSYHESHRLAYHAENLEQDLTSDIFEQAAEELTRHSPLFEKYYEPETGVVDTARFEADLYVREVAQLEQKFKAASDVKAAWNTKATTYIVHLTLLAVSLFLLGQASSLKRDFTKKTLYGTGVSLALVTFFWVLTVWVNDVPDLRDTGAIEYYSEGQALDHQGLYKEAIGEYDQALKAAPYYLDGYLARGLDYLELGRFSEAAADFEAALKLNPQDGRIAINLSEAYYEQGLFDKSIQLGKLGVQLAPDDLSFQGMLALTTLASGDVEAARSEYEKVRNLAIKTVADARAHQEQPPSFIWETLDMVSLDLEDLSTAAESGEGTPPQDKIRNPEAVIETCEVLRAEIDGLSVSLEYTGEPPKEKLTAEVSDLTFGLPLYDDEGELKSEIETYPDDVFPWGTGEVVVQFVHGKVTDGQDLVLRVFLNGDELPSWRMLEKWTYGDGDGETDHWYKVLAPGYSETTELDPGEYLVEFFFNGHLVLRDGFTIEDGEEELSLIHI